MTSSSSCSRNTRSADGRAKPLAGMPRHAAQYAGDPNGDEKAQKTFNESRRNFIALIFWYAKKMGDIDRQFDVHEE